MSLAEDFFMHNTDGNDEVDVSYLEARDALLGRRPRDVSSDNFWWRVILKINNHKICKGHIN